VAIDSDGPQLLRELKVGRQKVVYGHDSAGGWVATALHYFEQGLEVGGVPVQSRGVAGHIQVAAVVQGLHGQCIHHLQCQQQQLVVAGPQQLHHVLRMHVQNSRLVQGWKNEQPMILD